MSYQRYALTRQIRVDVVVIKTRNLLLQDCCDYFLASRLEALQTHFESRHPEASGMPLHDVKDTLRRTIYPVAPRIHATADSSSNAGSSLSPQRSKFVENIRFNPYTPCVQPSSKRTRLRKCVAARESQNANATAGPSSQPSTTGRQLQRHGSMLSNISMRSIPDDMSPNHQNGGFDSYHLVVCVFFVKSG